jgi:hypothetical protein
VLVLFQVLAATQTPGEQGKKWFQGTADAVRQFHWLFEVFISLKQLRKPQNICCSFFFYAGYAV